MTRKKTIGFYDVGNTSEYFRIIEDHVQAYTGLNPQNLRNNLIVEVLKKDKRYDFEPGTFLIIDRIAENEGKLTVVDYEVCGEFNNLEQAVKKQEETITKSTLL